MLVVDQVFEVAEQQRQKWLAAGNEDCGNHAREVLIGDAGESCPDMGAVIGEAANGLAGRAFVIDSERAQLLESAQGRAEPGGAIEDVAEQSRNGPCAGNRRSPVLASFG